MGCEFEREQIYCNRRFTRNSLTFLNLARNLAEHKVLKTDSMSIYRNFYPVFASGIHQIKILPAEDVQHKPRVRNFLEPASNSVPDGNDSYFSKDRV
jgi:hypothetical protein